MRVLAIGLMASLSVLATSVRAQTVAAPPPGKSPFETGIERPDAPKPSTDPRSLRGYYFMPLSGVLLRGLNKDDMPLNEQALALFKKRIADREAGLLPDDPMTVCRPMNAVRVFGSGFPQLQILQTPDEVLILLMEDHMVRRIYLNGKHPQTLAPTAMGHSIGHWDGDTLVVDTIGFKDNAWLDETGTPADHNEHMMERIRKVDNGQTIEDLVTIEDSTVFTRPISFRVTMTWRPSESWDEVICEEGNRDGLNLGGSDTGTAP